MTDSSPAVPEAAREAAVAAVRNPPTVRINEDEARWFAEAALSAALPHIREQIAQELDDYADGVPRTTTDPNAYARMVAYENAARIVRGTR